MGWRDWFRWAPRVRVCRWATEDDGGWGYMNKWYCLTHQRWYPGQSFMQPPKSCLEEQDEA